MLRFSMWRWCLLFPLHLTEKARLLPSVSHFLHLNSFFSGWSVHCCSCLTQGSTTASSEDIKNISARNSSCDTTLDHTCFFHCCINYFILFSAYRKISRYWHLPAHNHVILMGTSCPLSKSPTQAAQFFLYHTIFFSETFSFQGQ